MNPKTPWPLHRVNTDRWGDDDIPEDENESLNESVTDAMKWMRVEHDALS